MRSSSLLVHGLTVAVLLALGSRSEAGNWLKKHGDCASEVVHLPAQRVVVETARPRVTVLETRLPDRGLRLAPFAAVDVPYVATFFMPVAAAPVERESADLSPLRMALEMEHNALQLERLKAYHEADQRMTQRAFERASAALRDSTSAAARSTDAATMEQIRAELQRIDERITNLQKLVIQHDEYIKKQSGK